MIFLLVWRKRNQMEKKRKKKKKKKSKPSNFILSCLSRNKGAKEKHYSSHDTRERVELAVLEEIITNPYGFLSCLVNYPC